MKKILVIDGQGGGIGSRFIACMREKFDRSAEIIAVGTNSAATTTMLKAGANAAATGENPVLFNAPRCQIIVGPIAIIMANALLGEITPRMAEAVASSDAEKVLIPFSRCSVTIAGASDLSPDQAVIKAAEAVSKLLGIT